MPDKEEVKQEGRYVGVFLPQHIGSYLGLYSLCFELSLSEIVRGELAVWYDQKLEQHPEELLLENLTEKMQEGWDTRKIDMIEKLGTRIDKIETAFELYEHEVRSHLGARIEEELVTKIINNLIV